MAGTAPRGGDPAADAALAAALLASATYRHEHQITIDMVYDTLLPWCSYLDYEPEPSVVAVANVQHLATLVEGRLSQPAPSVLELVAGAAPDPGGRRLAPRRRPPRGSPSTRASTAAATPAPSAGSTRRATARGRSASAAPRSTARRARLYAGNGIVADSDPDTELAETQAKLSAMLAAAALTGGSLPTRTRRRTSVVGLDLGRRAHEHADEVAAAHHAELHGRLDRVPHDLVGACRACPSPSGRMPQAMASCRAVRGSGVRARIGQVGRNRLIMRAVAPELVQAMMAASSASTDARHAAAVMADVMRVVVGASCRPAICCWPRRVPQPS